MRLTIGLRHKTRENGLLVKHVVQCVPCGRKVPSGERSSCMEQDFVMRHIGRVKAALVRRDPRLGKKMTCGNVILAIWRGGAHGSIASTVGNLPMDTT